MDSKPFVVSVTFDDPFAIDIAHFLRQDQEIGDILSLKQFANTEFCPRFISDESSMENIGDGLKGRDVIIVSTSCLRNSRNASSMLTFITARGAKDNGARKVILIQPDLYYSAQDRGPRQEHGKCAFERETADYKKFDGQPFTSLLYAELLKKSGVDEVITIHNHSVSVQQLFKEIFEGRFYNLTPEELFARYLLEKGAGAPGQKNGDIVLCAPDKGAVPFVQDIFDAAQQVRRGMLLKPSFSCLFMDKVRSGERRVSIEPASDSPVVLEDICGRNVVVFDDMVRTGNTIVECCKILQDAGAAWVTFVVTHFYSSDEVKENLNHPAINEIITTNSLPMILNRDMQGRLRKKMLVIKIEKWVSNFLSGHYCNNSVPLFNPPYSIDMSSKNPRWQLHNGSVGA